MEIKIIKFNIFYPTILKKCIKLFIKILSKHEIYYYLPKHLKSIIIKVNKKSEFKKKKNYSFSKI